ncbi:MAG: UDP-N-acetylmuramate dehydrogenase [Candidatus Pacebacteria bacterium]|nr:UDP-N-acetylmuramate dehydrogenase [Candidatus Paceibacterota bacterium]
MQNSKLKIKKLLPEIKENISLKEHTTFRIGGRTRYFFCGKKKEDIIRATKTAKKINLPFFILGGGSNVLFSDKNFEGMVIKTQNSKLKIQNCNILAEAGTPLSLLVQKAEKNNLSGFEWAIGIPGTIGGAVYGNASALGEAIGNLVEWVEVLDLKNFKIKKFSKKECKFGYKNSIFKRKKNLVILSVALKLKKGNKEKIKQEMERILKIRKEIQPLNYPSGGCIFKNVKCQMSNVLPAGRHGKTKKLFEKFPELEEFAKKGEIPAGFLIDKAGLKGKRIGDAMISKKHANFIVNLKNAKAEDVKKLINYIKEKVKKIFGIELEEEIIIFPH